MNDPPPPALPAELDAFDAYADRIRQTTPALVALRGLARAWDLSRAEAAAMAGVSRRNWDRIEAGTWSETLSHDQLQRISAMLGVHRGLHLLFADDMADRWVRLRNAGPLFGGLTPIAAMALRGTAGIIEVRRYVDEMRLAH